MLMKLSRLQLFLWNGLLLALATCVLRTVAVAFNAFVSSTVGAEGMGLYTLVLSVYGFLVTFATSGVGLSSTRLVAEAIGHADERLLRASLRKCLLYAAFFGSVATLFLFFFAGYIGRVFLSDARTVLSLRALSFSLLPLALSSVLVGYFNAVRRSARNAVMQVFEMALRIGVTVLLLKVCLPRGLVYATFALVAGASVSEAFSFLFLFVQYLYDRRRYPLPEAVGEKPRGILRKLCKISLPIAFSAYVRSGLTTLEHVLIPQSLVKNGATREKSLASYGVICGMSLPILLYPAGILSSFTGLLVPEMAESVAKGEEKRIRYVTKRALSFALLFSLLSAGILFLLADTVGELIYHSEEAGYYVLALVPLVPVMYLDTTVDNILKGLGEQFFCMCVNVVDAALSVGLVLFFLPRFGAVGYVAVLLLAEIFNFSFSITRLLQKTGVQFSVLSEVLLPVGLTALSAFLVRFLTKSLVPSVASALMISLFFIAVSLLFYLLFGVLNREKRIWLRKICKPEKSERKEPRPLDKSKKKV